MNESENERGNSLATAPRLPEPTWYEPRDINHAICFNEDVKKILLKLSKDISIIFFLLQWRCEEKVVKIIKRCFNSCYIEEEWSLIVVNFGWVTI